MLEWLQKISVPLAQMPLIIGWWLWLRENGRVTLSAICLTVLYEVFVFGFSFLRKVWGKIEDSIILAVIDWGRGMLLRYSPDYLRRYFRQVMSDHGIYNVRGLGLMNTYTLRFQQVFVELRLLPSSNPAQGSPDIVASRELDGETIWNFVRVRNSEMGLSKALAVIGPPGCGKTTLLQHIALTLAVRRPKRYGNRAYVPVLLFLRDHISTIVLGNPPSLSSILESYFCNRTLYPTLRLPTGWFEEQMAGGKCLILLDGLDEVGAVEQRRIVANWIENQIKAYPECRFILSSRPQGFRDSQLQRVDVLEVQPFSAEQVREFVENWYAANEIMNSGGVDDMKVRERALNDANVLLQRLAVSAELSALAINPLLLTMVAMMHRYRGAVPRSRVELYAEICEVLLERWRQARGVQDNLTAAQKIIVLRQLAAYATERNLRQISTEDASAIIATPLKRIGIAAHERENFLYYLQETSGLLLEREAGHWTFVHHTFQEYLTAAQWQVERNTPRDWDKLVRNSWWYGTLAMYAAQGDGSSIMDACLEANTVQSLTLAAECLDVAQELDPELRQRAFEQLTEGMESNDPARRHIAAEVQLSRRLKLLHRIDERCEIDLSFLTCAEYQLFLDHKRAQGKHHQPDHWKDYRFSTNEGRSPIKGIRAEDAIAFCVWLTSRKGGSVRYRLPTPDEANKNPSIAREIATWCEDDTGLSLVGLTEREEQERIEQLSAFSYGTPVCSLRLVDVRGPDSVSWDISGSNELVQRVYRNLAFGIGISRAFNRTNDFPLVRALALDRDFTIESSREIAYSMAHALAKISGLPSIATSLEKKELSTARQQSSALLHGVPSEVTSVNSLLNEILAAATAENALQAQRAQRRCIAQMLVLAYGDNCQYVERVLKLYWWLQLVKGREEDKLASWEGIRVVREQVQI